MKPEAQRIAIAEACPNVFVRLVGHEGWNYRNSAVGRLLPCIDGDPLNDLNAMHEAEKALTGEQACIYVDTLDKIISEQMFDGFHRLRLLRSSASQRAEAFLRTVGKWTE